jgi:hypothetical protein
MFKVKEPSQTVNSPEVGLILLNHVGSTCTQDSGRDAQDLADHFGIQVIAANRPGTGWMLPRTARAKRISKDYVATISEVGSEISHEIGQRGIKRVVIAGRSAGGLGAMALTCTELLPTSHLYAAEPVGWFSPTLPDGRNLYRSYNKAQKLRFNMDNSQMQYIHPDPPDVKGWERLRRLASIPLLFEIDSFHNEELWASPIAVSLALYIGKNLTSVDTTIVFAEKSLVASQETIDYAMKVLPQIRKSGQPFVIDQLSYTQHASFDKRSFMAKRLEPAVHEAMAVN